MTRAELQQSEYDQSSRTFILRTLATLVVEDSGAYHGEHVERFGLSKTMLDPATRQRVVFADDPQRWLRLLPTAYRTGDLCVTLAEEVRES